MFYKQIGLNIAYYRKKQGLRQIDLAEKVGISITHMSRIERGAGVQGVPLSMYLRIAEILGVQIEDLSKK